MAPRRRQQSVLGLRRTAQAHERAGRLEEALGCWRRIVEVRPRSPDLLNRIGDILDRLGRPGEAVAGWASAARIHREDGFLLKAAALLRKAARRDPADLELLLEIADVHEDLGHRPEAKRLYLDVAERCLAGGQPSRAAHVLERLLDLDGDLAVRRALARLYERSGQAGKAAEHLTALAEACAGEGRPAEAREALERARALAPTDDRVHAALADVYLRLREWDRAVPAMEERAARAPRDAQVHLDLAECYVGAGRLDDARHVYRHLLDERPADDETRIRLGIVRGREGDLDGGFQVVEPALERLAERGDWRRAAAVLEELVGRELHVKCLLRLGVAYNRLGDRDALRRTYDRLADAHREAGDVSLARAVEEIRSALDGPVVVPRAEEPPSPVAAEMERRLDRAADLIRSATALVIAAGGELNGEFGWPDYRRQDHLWADFPGYRALGLGSEDLAQASRFELDPEMAWGFYARRLELARRRPPHPGLRLLGRWRALRPGGGFVVTSCVDGEFPRAGFDARRIVECCGSVDWVQCSKECGAPPFPSSSVTLAVDPETLRAAPPLPSCPSCGALARPNVLLLGDWAWDMSRATAQDERLRAWLRRRTGVVVLECGETPRLPAMRAYVERMAREARAPVVRISDEVAAAPDGGVAVPLGPRAGLEQIDERLRRGCPSGASE